MSAARFGLKQASGWFAAGREVERALTLLSDPAFKLFIWLCLHAERSTGSLCIQPSELAGALGTTETQIQAALTHLVQHGVCDLCATGLIEITEAFWPYQRVPNPEASPDRSAYIQQVKRLFLERRCVRSTFTAADELLASQLYRKNVSIQDVEHAILLGALRKYAAWINNGSGSPITSLHYFTALFDEVSQETSPDYWAYLAHKVRAVELRWPGFNAAAKNRNEMIETK